ncbi:hypothetical protein INR49_019072 [Caranx melampygus]|nr:hypothetical protein INR49_019072 [Caranx melampygus]
MQQVKEPQAMLVRKGTEMMRRSDPSELRQQLQHDSAFEQRAGKEVSLHGNDSVISENPVKTRSSVVRSKRPQEEDAVQLTGQHGEDGSKGVELESIDDVAGVEKLQTHETEADHQQQDVEHLRHHGQPQHTCKHTHAQGQAEGGDV